MTKLKEVRLKCPCCKKAFKSVELLSTNNCGPCTTDLLEMAGGTQPLPYWIHSCPHCGFTTSADVFSEYDCHPKLRSWVKKNITPLLKTKSENPSQEYESAARIAEFNHESDYQIAKFYVYAAWACYLERYSYEEVASFSYRDFESPKINPGILAQIRATILAEEIRYRLLAIPWLEKCVSSFHKPGLGKAYYTYVVAESYRRVGEAVQAAQWYNRVKEAAGSDPGAGYWVKLAKQQKTKPKEFIEEP